MSILDAIAAAPPQSVYLFPAPLNNSATKGKPSPSDVLHLQYWPQSLQDDYQPNYAEHQIPGGSHPLYQWVNGGGRTLTFQSVFTSELNITRGSVGAVGNILGPIASVSSVLTPSSQFTNDVAGALSRIRSFMLADYPRGGQQGITTPPQILTLTFPGTKLAGNSDSVNVILRAAPITIEAWYPNGEIRVATVDFTFNEVVQSPASRSSLGGGSGSSVKFIGRSDHSSSGAKYTHRGLSDRPFIGGPS